MRLVRSLCTVVKPVLNTTVLLPGIVASQNLDSGHAWVSEDFILLVENSYSFLGLTIFLTDYLRFVVLGKESCLFHNVLVLLDQVGMTSRKALKK
jgi:hypothetical protein